MPRPQIIKNPFYLLLALVGFAFVLTVCAYWLMSLAAIRDPLAENPRAGLLGFLEMHGTTLLLTELGALLVLCMAAMMTDGFWMRIWDRKAETAARDAEKTSAEIHNSEGKRSDESHAN